MICLVWCDCVCMCVSGMCDCVWFMCDCVWSVWNVWLRVVHVWLWLCVKCAIVCEMCDCVCYGVGLCVCVLWYIYTYIYIPFMPTCCFSLIFISFIYICVCVICAWCVSVHEVCGVWYGLIVYNSMVYMLWCVVWSICCGMVCGMVCDEKSMLACIMGLHQSRNTQDYLFWLSMDSLPWTARTLHSALYTLLAHQSMQFVNKERYISSVYFHTSVSNTDRQLSLVYISSGIIQFLVDMYDKCNPSCKPATSWQVQHIFLDKSSIYSLISPADIPWQVQHMFLDKSSIYSVMSYMYRSASLQPSQFIHLHFLFFLNLSLLSFSYG